MPLQVKIGGVGTGSWSPSPAAGKLRIQPTPNGTSWVVASFLRIKVGPKGGGSWHDSGYVGIPGVPPAPTVQSYNGFSGVAIQWGAPPPGGAPAVSYDEEQLDSAGNQIAYYQGVQSPSGYWGTVEDGLYQFHVRSRSAAGLVSAWSPLLQVRMGHSETGHNETRYATRGWESTHQSGERNMDNPFWDAFGSNIVLSGIHWRNLYFPSGAYVSPSMTAKNDRFVNWIYNGGDFGHINNDFGPVHSHDDTDYNAYNNVGTGQPWGIVPRGLGWSQGYQPDVYGLWCDAFWLSGTETYAYSVYVMDRAYKANQDYW